VDPRLQDLQGKAKRVKPADLLHHLLEIYGEKAALRRRHEAAARIAGQYDVNNTYQYIIAREDQHLSWLADAIQGMGGTVPGGGSEPLNLPGVKGDQAFHAVVQDDARSLDAFVDTWRPRASGIAHARHKLMLELMLGETQEQARLFHQAAAGRLDLLGRRTGGDRTPGSVLPTRWVE
jgi:hypothetical protein